MKLSWLVSIVLAWGLGACTDTEEAPRRSEDVPRSAESSRPVVQSAARAESAAEQSIEARAEELLNFGETSAYGTDLLWPHATTQSWGPFRFRHYPRKGESIPGTLGATVPALVALVALAF